jgi:hypothetical protein
MFRKSHNSEGSQVAVILLLTSWFFVHAEVSVAGLLKSDVMAPGSASDPLAIRVRPSNTLELAVRNHVNPTYSEIDGGRIVWKIPSGILWQAKSTRIGYQHRPINDSGDASKASAFDLGTPLSIIVPFFDYSRAVHFAIEEQLVGHQIYIDAYEVLPSLFTLEHRFPEDQGKEYINIVDSLRPGRYDVVARFFSIKLGDWTPPDESAIDFAEFRQSPLQYKLPIGASLQSTMRTGSFVVVPEPSTIAFIGILAISLGNFRRLRFCTKAMTARARSVLIPQPYFGVQRREIRYYLTAKDEQSTFAHRWPLL